MGAVTEIAWTHSTFNPWSGCAKVAPGCANCYAEALMDKRWGKVQWGPNGTRKLASESSWRQPLKWNREAEAAGERRRVFCASLADVFEDWDGPIVDSRGDVLHWCVDCTQIAPTPHRVQRCAIAAAGGTPPKICKLSLDDVRRRLFALIDATPNLDWLILTKRPENIRKFWPQSGYESDDHNHFWRPNVWLLTSVSEQASADKNIPELLDNAYIVPVLGVSAEPLLGPIDFAQSVVKRRVGSPQPRWIIVGGESGPNRRVCEVGDIVSIVEQCKAAGVPCFVKQDAGAKPGQQGRIPDEIWACKEFPASGPEAGKGGGR